MSEFTDTSVPAGTAVAGDRPTTDRSGHGDGASGPSGPDERSGRARRPSLLVTVVVAAAVAAATSFGVLATVGEDTDGVPSSAAEPTTGDVSGSASPTALDSASDVMTVADVAAAAAPSVAAVEVTIGTGGPLGGPSGSGRGSAVILDADGLLVTNAHVVANASEVAVTLADGARHEAEIVGVDETTDLAVLSIDATDLPAAELATELPAIGTTTVAIGSPFGLDGSVSSGIVSALDRSLGGPQARLDGLIQTDAAINPGNSGGALLDDRARVIGINTAILSGSGTSGGVGFAVPSTTVRDITDQLVATGTVERAVLGVQGQDVDPEVARLYSLGTDAGALIVAVAPDSAAARAGLQAGDIVTEVDGAAVRSMTELAAQMRDRRPGDTLVLEIVRGGSTTEVPVELGSAS